VTQVVDGAYQRTAAGVRVRLPRATGNAWSDGTDAETDGDGSIREWRSRYFDPGLYRIVFGSSDYFGGLSMVGACPEIGVMFRMGDASRLFRVHVTLFRIRTLRTLAPREARQGNPEAITYTELDRQARGVRRMLAERCIRGAPIMLLYPPGLGYKAELFGCPDGGAIAVPVYLPERTSRAGSWRPHYDSVGLIGGIIQPRYDGFPVTLLTSADFRAQTMERFARAGFGREAFRPCYGLSEAALLITGETPWSPDETRAFGVVAPRGGVAIRGTAAHGNPRFPVSCGVPPHDGRTEDLVVIHGRKYRTQDIELTVQQSSSVLRHGRCAACTVADDGENRLVIVTEVIRQASRLDVGKIAAAIRAAVAAEHCLQVHTVVLLPPGALPKTSSGKVQRRLCAALFNRGRLPELGRSVLAQMFGSDRRRLGRRALLAVRSAARRDLLREYLGRLVASTCQAEEAQESELGDAPLPALGSDTYAMINIQYSVETDLGVHLTLADLSQAANLSGLAARLDELLAITVSPPRHENLPLDRSPWFIRDIEIAAGERFGRRPGNVPAPPDPTHFVRQYSWISGSRMSAPPRTEIVTARGNAGR
jgi:5-hydroxyisourate hydrolase-like protein (transthyretin family)